MRHETTAETLARLILWGLDQAVAGRPRPLRLRSALEPGRGLVFDWLADLGLTPSKDGQWLIWRSPRLA
jgi:hypothetical protein